MSYEPYQPPSDPAPGPAQAPAARSGGRLLMIGLVLSATAGVVLALAVRTMVSGFPADAYVPADDEQHELHLPADAERGIWLRSGDSVRCTLTDSDGDDIALGRPGGTYQLNDWTAQHVFDTGDGTVVITCSPTPGAYLDAEIRIGPVSGFAHAMIAVFVSIVAVLVLLAGLGMALAFTRRRRRAAPPATAR